MLSKKADRSMEQKMKTHKNMEMVQFWTEIRRTVGIG